MPLLYKHIEILHFSFALRALWLLCPKGWMWLSSQNRLAIEWNWLVMGTELESKSEPASKLELELANKTGSRSASKTGNWSANKIGNWLASKIGNWLASKIGNWKLAGKQNRKLTGKWNRNRTEWQEYWNRNREANRNRLATKPEAVGDGFGDQVEPTTRRDWIMQQTKVKWRKLK